MTADETQATEAVRAAARAARAAAPGLASAPDGAIDAALGAMARALDAAAPAVLAANERGHAGGRGQRAARPGCATGCGLTSGRLKAMAGAARDPRRRRAGARRAARSATCPAAWCSPSGAVRSA